APLSEALRWHILSILVEHGGPNFAVYKDKLGVPATVRGLSYEHRDRQYPAGAIDADEGTYDGNWDVLLDIFTKQRHIGEDFHKDFVSFLHGDLGTKERIDGLKKMRKIEANEWRRLDGIIFIPGLFHVKMAAANAYWRIHVQPAGDRNEPLGAFEYISKLRPKATGEFTSKTGPSFRAMHDSIHHIAWVDILDIWRVEVKSKFGLDSLDAWAKTKPSWDAVESLSRHIFEKHLPGDEFEYEQEESDEKRDQVFENMCLRNQHGLLYLEFCRAMNAGDVGRILQLLPYF
ncbi:hypothetical protein BDZ89DRAFT_935750, partial [Hymenopellis radicata]